MKTKIKIKSIKDTDTDVEINSPLHHIENIKEEIQDCFEIKDMSECETEVLEMWNKDD